MIEIKTQRELNNIINNGSLLQNELIRIWWKDTPYIIDNPISITKSFTNIEGYGIRKPIIQLSRVISDKRHGVISIEGTPENVLEHITIKNLHIISMGNTLDNSYAHGIYGIYIGKAQTAGGTSTKHDADTTGMNKENKIGIRIIDCEIDGYKGDNIYMDNIYNSMICKCKSHNSRAIGIEMKSSSNNMIADNILYNNQGNGITLDTCSNNIIEHNIIRDNQHHGIYITRSSSNIISSNDIYNHNHGMYLTSDSTVISENIIRNSKVCGIYDTSHYNTIIGNIIQGNNDGMSISHYSTIAGNSITHNTRHGIHVRAVIGNAVAGNNIQYNNGNGIFLQDSRNTIGTGNISISNEGGNILDEGDNNSFVKSYNHLGT